MQQVATFRSALEKASGETYQRPSPTDSNTSTSMSVPLGGGRREGSVGPAGSAGPRVGSPPGGRPRSAAAAAPDSQGPPLVGMPKPVLERQLLAAQHSQALLGALGAFAKSAERLREYMGEAATQASLGWRSLLLPRPRRPCLLALCRRAVPHAGLACCGAGGKPGVGVACLPQLIARPWQPDTASPPLPSLALTHLPTRTLPPSSFAEQRARPQGRCFRAAVVRRRGRGPRARHPLAGKGCVGFCHADAVAALPSAAAAPAALRPASTCCCRAEPAAAAQRAAALFAGGLVPGAAVKRAVAQRLRVSAHAPIYKP